MLLRAEILRRGQPMVPLLTAALKQEIDTTRPKTSNSPPPGLIADETALLVELGEPDAVPVFLDILTSAPPHRDLAFNDPRTLALGALEKLTFVLFHKARPHFDNYADAVQHPDALPLDTLMPDNYSKVAQLYRHWLDTEGKNPAQWLSLAQTRARKMLESDDLDAAYCAAAFLTGARSVGLHATSRDDDPERTMKRIAQIIDAATPVHNSPEHHYVVGEKPLPISIFNWIDFLASYGPRARPYAPLFLRLQKDTEPDNQGALEEMRKVGGREIMARFFDLLPTLSAEVDKISRDPNTPKGFSSNDPRRSAIVALGQCRAGIDRWAGRCFDADADRLAWWNANKTKSPRQWLEDALPIAVQRADAHAGDPHARDPSLFHEILPDAPYAENEIQHFRPPGVYLLGTQREPFRQKWFEAHRHELTYDPAAGAFRLPNPTAH